MMEFFPCKYRVVGSRSIFGRQQKALRISFAIGLLSALGALAGCGGSSGTISTSSPLAITTSSLPTGQVGTAYSAALTATGGTAPYAWSLSGGTLPAGLKLNTSTGAITGIPTAAASAAALTISVTDSGSPAQSKSVNLSLTIAAAGAASLSISTISLPNGELGTAYSSTLAAHGGTTPYSWSLTSGTLPAGLILTPAAGIISGTPTAAVNAASLTFMVTDSSTPAQTQSVTLNLTITATTPSPLSITTMSLPSGQVGAAYTTTLTASGGTTPYTWSLTSGTLPAGLILAPSTGIISGTPTANATATSLAFTVTDSSTPAQNQSVTLSLTVSSSGTTATCGESSQTGTDGGNALGQLGTPCVTGTNSAGYTVSSISYWVGTPASTSFALGVYSDSSSTPNALLCSVLTGTITPSSGWNTTAISGCPTLTASTPYWVGYITASNTIQQGIVSGACPGTSSLYSVWSSNDQSGVSLSNPFGSSAPNPNYCYSVYMTLNTVSGSTGSLAITTTSLPNGAVGTSYSATLAASGGTTPYTWSLTIGTLPTGLTLNTATGAITGTPTVAASATSLTFEVTDSENPAQSVSATLGLTVNPSVTSSTCGETSQSGTDSGNVLGQLGTPCVTGTNSAGYTVSSISYWVGTPTSTSFDLGVYSDSSGTPNALLCSVSTGTITPSSGWNMIGISGCPTLAASSPYWVGYITGSNTLQQGTVSGACPGTTSSYSVWANSDPQPTVSLLNPFGSATPVSSGSGYCYSLYMTLNTVPSSGITVSVSPQQTGITINQTLSLTPTTTDTAGVNWSVTGSGCSGTACGTVSSATSLTGVAVTYTPPSSAGVYTITASSVTTNSIRATATVGVTDLAGMTTYHNDLYRDGANAQEYALNTSNVTNSAFGKLFSCAVDEAVYAQPLWVPDLSINGAVHNVIFVATQNDSLYAFDADSNTTPCTPLWQVNLLDTTSHGGTPGETSVPSSGTGALVGSASSTGGDIQPEVGVTGTPVIDPSTNTLYVVSKSVIASGPTFFQRLHAIDLATGTEKFLGPATIAATYPGTADGSSTTTFVPQVENQRAGLALVNGTVYISWASHEDIPILGAVPPFYGWIMGYSASDLTIQPSVFNVAPNVPSSPMAGEGIGDGGIWMSGGAPAADSSGNLYVITANGVFDPTTNNYGDTLLQLSPSLTVSSNYFTPTDQLTDDESDTDFGSGGAVLIDLPANGGNPTHLIAGGGKDAALYLLNRDAMDGYGDSNALQKSYFTSSGFHGIFATPAFWNSTLYISAYKGQLVAFTLNPSASLTQRSDVIPETFAKFGPTPSVSSTPNNSNGIVWIIDAAQYCTDGSPDCGPAVLRAYDATNLSNEIWNSTLGSGNSAGNAVKFTVPTVANGKVYVGTRGNNTGGADNSTTTPGELDVYGLLPN
jgi:Putative Ig domain